MLHAPGRRLRVDEGGEKKKSNFVQTHAMADHPPPLARTAAARPANSHTASSGIRRNLFQSRLTRRPTPTSSNSGESLRLDAEMMSDSSDIVVRDKNGEFEIGDPPTPPLDEPEDEALDDVQEHERTPARCVTTGLLQDADTATGERHKLAEVVKHHQISHSRSPAEPEGTKKHMTAVSQCVADRTRVYRSHGRPAGQHEGTGGRFVRRQLDVRARRTHAKTMNHLTDDAWVLLGIIVYLVRMP